MSQKADITGADVLIIVGTMTPPIMNIPAFHVPSVDALDPAALHAFLDNHVQVSSVSTAIIFVGSETEHEKECLQNIINHYHKARIQLHTLRMTSEWGFNFIKTLSRDPTWGCQHGYPLSGQSVFIAGAGQSLNDFREVLPEIHKRGILMCPNSAVGALKRAGVTPDVVTYAEWLHLPHHLEGYSGPVLLDCLASQRAWDYCETHCVPMAATKCDPEFLGYLMELGVTPTKYSISAFNLAISQAFAWGAREVILLGASFCTFPDGQVYAAGSPFDDLREMIKEGQVHTEGISKQQPPVGYINAPAIGGGTLPSAHHFADEIEWISTCASKLPVKNLNRRGVSIPNTIPTTLEDVLSMPLLNERYNFSKSLPKRSTKSVLDTIEKEARSYLATPTSRPPFGILKFFARQALLMQSGAKNEEERKQKLVDAMGLGAVGMLRILTGAD